MKCKWFTRLSTRPQNAAFGWNDFYSSYDFVLNFNFSIYIIFPLCFSQVLCHFGIIFFFVSIFYSIFCSKFWLFSLRFEHLVFIDSCSFICFSNFQKNSKFSHTIFWYDYYKMNKRCSLSRDNIEKHVLCG